MSYDRRWLDEPHVGDHVGRSVWALGEILATAWIPARRRARARPARRGSSARSPARSRCERPRTRCSGSPVSTPTGSSRRRGSCSSASSTSSPTRTSAPPPTTGAGSRTSSRYDNARLSQALISGGDALGRDDLVELGLESLRWLGDECGLDGRRPAPAGPPRTPARRAGAGQRRRAAARRRGARRGRAGRVRRHARARARRPRATRAFEWFLGRNRLQRPLYDFATGGCSDGLGSETLNENEGAESTLALHRAALLLDAAGVRAAVRRTRARAGGGVSAARALRPPPGQSDPHRGGLAVSGQRRLQPGRSQRRRRDRPARPRRGPHGESRTSPSPARRTASTTGRSTPSRCSRRPTASRASSGDSRTRASSGSPSSSRWVITCTAYGPAGPAVFLATTEDFTIGRAPRDRQAARGQERRAPPATGSTAAGCSSTGRRPSSAAPTARSSLSRSDDLVNWSAPEQVLQPARRRVVGLAADRHRAAAAPDRARLAAHLPRRQGNGRRRASTASASRCSTSTSRRASCAGFPAGCSRRWRRTSGHGDVPNVVFPCGLVHDEATGEVRLYYGAADTLDLPRHRPARRPARGRARRSGGGVSRRGSIPARDDRRCPGDASPPPRCSLGDPVRVCVRGGARSARRADQGSERDRLPGAAGGLDGAPGQQDRPDARDRLHGAARVVHERRPPRLRLVRLLRLRERPDDRYRGRTPCRAIPTRSTDFNYGCGKGDVPWNAEYGDLSAPRHRPVGVLDVRQHAAPLRAATSRASRASPAACSRTRTGTGIRATPPPPRSRRRSRRATSSTSRWEQQSRDRVLGRPGDQRGPHGDVRDLPRRRTTFALPVTLNGQGQTLTLAYDSGIDFHPATAKTKGQARSRFASSAPPRRPAVRGRRAR